jgi:hypothetical protein
VQTYQTYDGETIWEVWNQLYTASVCSSAHSIQITTSGSSCSNDTSWISWNRDYTTNGWYTPVTSNVQVWSSWNNSYVRSAAPVFHIGTGAQMTPEEREAARVARAAQEAQWAAERKVQDEERAAAKARAQKLLLSVLNEDQKRDWVAHGHFYLHKGDKKYRIKRGRSGNVELVDSRNEPLERYCAHPVESVPDEDTALAQMMMLLYDEEKFIALANVHFTKAGFVSQKAPLRRAA